MGLDPGQGRVEGQLADGDAHAVDAEVAEAEDALAVGDDNGAHVVLGPVLQDLVDVALVVDGDEEALGNEIEIRRVVKLETPGRNYLTYLSMLKS